MAKTEIGIFTDAYIRQDKTLPFVVVEEASILQENAYADFVDYWDKYNFDGDRGNIKPGFLEDCIFHLDRLENRSLIDPGLVKSLNLDFDSTELLSRFKTYNLIKDCFAEPTFDKSESCYDPKAISTVGIVLSSFMVFKGAYMLLESVFPVVNSLINYDSVGISESLNSTGLFAIGSGMLYTGMMSLFDSDKSQGN